MAYKFIISFAFLALCNAGLLPVADHGNAIHTVAASPVLLSGGGHENHGYEQHAPANYEFGYSVHDESTGDVKSQHEVRQGDNVQGQYSLVEPDGHRRVVDYSADAHNGFNAQVRREGGSSHPIAHNGGAIVATHAAPVAYTQQVGHIGQQIGNVGVGHLGGQVSYAQHAAPVAYTQQVSHVGQQIGNIGVGHLGGQVSYAQHATPVAYTQQVSHVGQQIGNVGVGHLGGQVSYTQRATPVAYTQQVSHVGQQIGNVGVSHLGGQVAYAQHATPVAYTQQIGNVGHLGGQIAVSHASPLAYAGHGGQIAVSHSSPLAVTAHHTPIGHLSSGLGSVSHHGLAYHH